MTLGIHVNHTRRGYVKPPNIAPVLALLDTQHLVNKISASVPTSADKKHLALPPDAAAIGCATALVEHAATPPRGAYQTIGNIGRSVFTLPADEHSQGLDCWLIAWYESARGERGPESVPLTFAII